MLEKLWDDVLAGPQPDRGLRRLRRISTSITDTEAEDRKYQKSLSMPASPGTPSSPASPRTAENVWRSVFNPGSNLATKSIGSNVFDKPQANSPTVYDWLYSEGTRSRHR